MKDFTSPSPETLKRLRAIVDEALGRGGVSTWQQLGILAHNLIRSFQLDTLTEPKPRPTACRSFGHRAQHTQQHHDEEQTLEDILPL